MLLNSMIYRIYALSLRLFDARMAVASTPEVQRWNCVTRSLIHTTFTWTTAEETNDNSKKRQSNLLRSTLHFVGWRFDGSPCDPRINFLQIHEDHGGAWELPGIAGARLDRPKYHFQYLERASILTSLEIWSAALWQFQYTRLDAKNDASGICCIVRHLGRPKTNGCESLARDY